MNGVPVIKNSEAPTVFLSPQLQHGRWEHVGLLFLSLGVFHVCNPSTLPASHIKGRTIPLDITHLQHVRAWLALACPAGWADIRLLAPRAELRLLLTGNESLIDGSKLSFLGEALRALLVLEMRGLTVGDVGSA